MNIAETSPDPEQNASRAELIDMSVLKYTRFGLYGMSDKTGKPYEKLAQVVFQSIVNQSDVRNVVVRHNVTLQGKHNSHRIDVYWKFAMGHLEYETVVEAKDFAAARTPFNWCCSLPNCFSSFLSSRLIAARMSMNPPQEIYINQG